MAEKRHATVRVESDFTWGTAPDMGITVRKNSADPTVGPRNRLNLIEGNHVGITVADDAGNNEVDVTLTSNVAVRKNSGAVVGTRPQINLIEGTNITLTVADDAGSGEVDVTVAAASSDDNLLFSERVSFLERAGIGSTAAFDQIGFGTVTAGGTFSSSLSTDTSGHYTIMSQATVGGSAGLSFVAGATRRRYNPTVYFIVKQLIAVAPLRTWVALANSTTAGSSDDPTTFHVAGFRYVPGTDTNWKAYTADGAASTITDTLIPVTDDTRVKFSMTLSATNVKFYINDVLVATHTTTLPEIDTTLGLIAMNRRNAGTVLFAIARVKLRQAL